jgi:hypothetical protein
MRADRNEREERGGDNIRMYTCMCFIYYYTHVLSRKWCALYKEGYHAVIPGIDNTYFGVQ